ncbi:hypothetical protein [Arenibaculum pallidiluteum]|nr:hypothetical protein [Arenibaculum pallidiluteum]
MDIWITFFGVVVIGGAVVFLFLRRDRGAGSEQHTPDREPSLTSRGPRR